MPGMQHLVEPHHLLHPTPAPAPRFSCGVLIAFPLLIAPFKAGFSSQISGEPIFRALPPLELKANFSFAPFPPRAPALLVMMMIIIIINLFLFFKFFFPPAAWEEGGGWEIQEESNQLY